MSRSFLTAQRVWPITLAVTAAISILPPGALKWTMWFKDFEAAILAPFAEFGSRLGGWIRPAPKLADSEEAHMLVEEANGWKRLYYLEHATAEDLRGKVEQLQKAAMPASSVAMQPLVAPISMRSAVSGLGTVSLSRGSTHGVRPGTIAVYNGEQLVGRVTSDVSSMQCVLLPLANAATGPIKVRAMGKNEVRPREGQAFQIEPVGDGTFLAEPDESVIINPGDEVRLFDPPPAWAESAQQMVIGIVESVRKNDRKPLRNMVIIRPALQISQLAEVVLKIEKDSEAK